MGRLLAMLLCLVGTLPLTPLLAAGSTAPVILVVGDSLSAAYRIAPEQGWVNLLQRRLDRQGLDYRVVNASISGDTTLGGLNRLPAALARHDPAVVILELGANDGLQGLPIDAMQDNLAKMIRLSEDAGARVLLLGMQLPPNYGPAYTHAFSRVYKSLAESYDTALVPFLLEKVALQRELMQEDNLHPTAEAQPQLLDTVWPQLQPLLKPAMPSEPAGRLPQSNDK